MKTNRVSSGAATLDYDRIAVVIRYLERHWHERPSLEALAERAGLSKFHFQRLFRRWAGISPKRFTQLLTLDQAKRALADGRSLLDAAFDANLSGPGRLHDLFVAIEAVTPGQFKHRGEGLRIRYGVHASPFGRCLVGLTSRGICWLSFVDAEAEPPPTESLREAWPHAELHEDPTATAAVTRQIFALRRRSPRPRVRLCVAGTNFQLKVWAALLRIPPGSTASYEEVACFIGRPRASRAVGQAVAANPIAYLIPCHRVIRSTGVIGNYGWGGSVRKRAMLCWEAARCSSADGAS